MYVPWIVLFSADRWPLDVLTFLIHGFDIGNMKFYISVAINTKAGNLA